MNDKTKTNNVNDITVPADNAARLLNMVQPMQAYKNTFENLCTQIPPRLSTGILSLDIVLSGGLADELYILGAETSTGKSALMMFIAQKLAESKTANVLYYALEMGKKEFVARGISTISYEQQLRQEKKHLIKASDILYNSYEPVIKDFVKMPFQEYKEYSDIYFEKYGTNLFIVEPGPSGITVKDIANSAALFKKKCGNTPTVVFVDYLQLIKADPKDRSQSDRKSKTDATVATLKTLASQIGMPVITASSISRAKYGERISTASYKESGDLEFTGGCLIGWNWEGVTTEADYEKQEKEKEVCRKRGFRHMTLDILKFRNAERDTAVHLKYYPAYNYFEDYQDFADMH